MQQNPEDQAIETARRYAQAINEWERDFEQEWSAHAATYAHGAPEHILAAYRERDRAIFQRYATDKVRSKEQGQWKLVSIEFSDGIGS